MKSSELLLVDYIRAISKRKAAQKVCDALHAAMAEAGKAFDSAYATEKTVRNCLEAACFDEAL